MAADLQKIKEIKERYEPQWLARKEIAAIGIGKVDDEIGIIISVTENPEKTREDIPAQIEGIPVKIQQTGSFNAQ